jgi:hypothetical protein
VEDPTGATVPNAKVTVTGPSLQVPQVSVMTDAEGNYIIRDLPAPGVYRVQFIAEGYESVVREKLNIGVGFTAKVDATLRVGSANESIVVNGGNPVVDTVSTASTTNLQQQEIQNAPKGLGIQELLPMAAGVSLQGKPDVGDSNLAARSSVITYGVVLNPTLDIEQINTTTNKDADTSVYLNATSLAEVEFKASGNNAEVAYPGVYQLAVMKSGSNTFHGEAQFDWQPPALQANNVNSTLAAQGIKTTNPLLDSGYYDYAANIGGRILTDKLWFFFGYSNQNVTQGMLNFFAGPDSKGCWTCPDSVPGVIHIALPQYAYKINYQLTSKVKLLFSDMYANKFSNAQQASPLLPLESTTYQHNPGSAWHGEVIAVPNSRFLIDALFGHGGYHTIFIAQPASNTAQYGYTKGSDFPGSPSEEELSNKLFTGPNDYLQNLPQNRWQMKANVSIFTQKPHLGATHQFKIGTEENWEIAGNRVLENMAHGNYLLQFQDGLPNKIQIFNYPILNATNYMFSQAYYAIDNLVVKHLAINLGVRGETFHSFAPPQSTVAGQFSNIFPVKSYPELDVLRWTDVVPRVGAAWDVGGNGKTVVKATFGMFGDTMGDLFAQTFNPNSQQTRTYNWTGPCAATDPLAPVQYACDVTPGFLATLPNLPVQAQTGGASQILNKDLKQDRTFEYTAAVERQVIPNMAVSATYVRHVLYNLYDASTNPGVVNPTVTYVGNGINVGHPYSSWTNAISFPDTDPATGQTTNVNVLTYPAGSGSTANEVVSNPSDRPDIYNSFAAGLTKRYSSRWNLLASYWLTKNHRWINALAGRNGSPNDDHFPTDDTWNWEARANLSYNFPKGFSAYSFFRAQSGTPAQRLSVFNTGGAPVPPNGSVTLQQGSTTLRMSPFGAYRGPVISTLNVKLARVFTFHERYKLEGNFQVFNLLNTSAAVATNYQTNPRPTSSNPNPAPTFGQVSSIISPRVARFGVHFSF